jgi:hypothetical protein
MVPGPQCRKPGARLALARLHQMSNLALLWRRFFMARVPVACVRSP